ncbi:MAG: hypothetical protein ACIARR_10695 [Phycisphaerales bacterium JB059]
MRPHALHLLLPTIALTLTAACDEAPSANASEPENALVAPGGEAPAQPESPAEAPPPSGTEAQGASDEAEPVEEKPRVRKSRVVRRFEMEAEGLLPLMTSEATKEFLDQVSLLHNVPIRRIFVRQGPVPEAVAEAEFHMLPEEIKDALRPVEIDTTKYYQTIYGSPLAYARPLDLVAAHAGWESFENKKILDFGYGQVGQLRMLAQCGADVTGIEASSMIAAMYTLPGDTGEFTGTTDKTGRLSLYQGYWPAGKFARENVGTGYDLIMARNVLRKGPMDLENPDVRPELRVRLRVTPELFIARMNEALNMGGYAIVYNIGGAGPELWDQFPASDFSCPFTREQWEAAGFEVIADNTMDSEPMRAVGKAIFLDRGPNGISLETQMYAAYTLVKKVGETTIPGQANAPADD